MGLSKIILKNVKYNIKNYMAYLLGNSIIQCILFMFCTLVVSPEFLSMNEDSSIRANFTSFFSLMIVFSVAYILFTVVSFTKFRGKEIGVYFTIGFTSKEILKILVIENIIISLSSFFIAVFTGSIFSKLFNMVVCKILSISNMDIPINIKSFGLVFLIAIAVFIFTTIYQFLFLNRYSVIEIIKSKSKKDIGSTNLFWGIVGIVMFITSLILFKKGISDAIDDSQMLLQLSVVGTVISIYLLIGFSMTVFVKILKFFKKTYNNNILFANSLTHRFVSFRNVLYVVTIMVSAAMVCIAVAYGNYMNTKKYIDNKYPYDVSMIVSKEEYDEDKLVTVLNKHIDNIRSFNKIESLNLDEIRTNGNMINGRIKNILVVSNENYKSLTGNIYDIEKGSIVYLRLEKANGDLEEGFMLEALDETKLKEKEMSIEDFKNLHEENEYLNIPVENVTFEVGQITNYTNSRKYVRFDSLILNDDDYAMLKSKLSDSKMSYDILLNIDGNIDIEELKDELKNNLGEHVSESLSVKENEFNNTIKENGLMLFLCTSLGLMFLIGSGAIIYFKIITNIDQDRERDAQLVKIGLTQNEINKLTMKELGAIFFVPPVIAIIYIGYFLSTLYDFINDGEYLWINTLYVFAGYLIIQVIFYLLTSSKYKKMLKV